MYTIPTYFTGADMAMVPIYSQCDITRSKKKVKALLTVMFVTTY